MPMRSEITCDSMPDLKAYNGVRIVVLIFFLSSCVSGGARAVYSANHLHLYYKGDPRLAGLLLTILDLVQKRRWAAFAAHIHFTSFTSFGTAANILSNIHPRVRTCVLIVKGPIRILSSLICQNSGGM